MGGYTTTTTVSVGCASHIYCQRAFANGYAFSSAIRSPSFKKQNRTYLQLEGHKYPYITELMTMYDANATPTDHRPAVDPAIHPHPVTPPPLPLSALTRLESEI